MAYYTKKQSVKRKIMEGRQLSDLVKMDSPKDVLEEVQIILHLVSPVYDVAPVTSAFILTENLYTGTYKGYQACNTEYHDLNHITGTFLTMARLFHGAVIDGESFTDRQIALGLIASLVHDTGYIQEEHDKEGTGSKYTINHVQRSLDFLEAQCAEYGLSEEETHACRTMILCTDLDVNISTISFITAKIELISKMLGTADLIAQMADRKYLEKLLFLYQEFREAKVDTYDSEEDLLRKTVRFYDFIAQHLETTLDATDRFIKSHMSCRWGINANLYQEAIEKQKNYLLLILSMPDSDPCDYLRRKKIAGKARKKRGKKI